jgi:hypothetical protein
LWQVRVTFHIANSFLNNGTFTQDSSHTTYFDKSNATETLSGNGTTTFGNITIGGPTFSFPTSVDAGSHSFTVSGRTFKFSSNNSSFSGNTSTINFALSAQVFARSRTEEAFLARLQLFTT